MNTLHSIRSLSLSIPAAALLLAGATASQAQTPVDQIVPFAADVKSLQVVLQPSGLPATLKFANSGNNVFYFPAVGIQSVEIRSGSGQLVPFMDAQGRLQLPGGAESAILSITLRDFLQDSGLQNEILGNLATNNYVRQFAPIPVLAPAAVQPGRVGRLIFNDPSANNARRILGESQLTDADGNPSPRASFLLNANALALLRTAPDARYLSVVVDQSYRAQFRTTELSVMLQSAQESLASVLRSLRSIPQGRPTYLLSPSLPLQMPGGWVGKDSSFTSRVRIATKLDVLVRQGSTADPNLVDRMLGFAFNQANLAMAISAQERQTAVATVLLDDGLSITLPIGRLREVALDIRNDTTSKWSSAFINAATKNQRTEVHGSADADVFGLFGASASADVIQDWSRSDYVNSKLDQFSQQLNAMSASLSGDIMYVTGMSFSDSGTVQNVSFTEVEQNLTQFSVDDATLSSTRSLWEYAQQLNLARQVETLLVPQVLVGVKELVGYDGWVQATNEWIIRKAVPVVFSKPFATAPDVVAAHSIVNWDPTFTPSLLYVFASQITTQGFTLNFGARAGHPIYWYAVSWIATGQARMSPSGGSGGLASLGTPGTPALIPAEARQAVLTPQMQSAPQLVDGQFRASFNAIPGRDYYLESSTNLLNWSTLGSAIASDFDMNIEVAAFPADPMRFFRIMTP